MRLLVCGTAAAEAWPGLFCVCAACVEAARLGGKNVRSRAAYMLGDRIRIDFGPDSVMHQHRYGLRYDRLEHLLVTHSHEDHWHPHELYYRRSGFSVVPDRPLHVWCNDAVADRFIGAGCDWESCRCIRHALSAQVEVDLGEEISAVPVAASHAAGEAAMNFVLRTPDTSLLIGHDTGWYGADTWGWLAGRQLGLALMDCTYGSADQSSGHLGCAAVVRMRDEMVRRGALAHGATFYATHFSHNGGWLHDELEAYFSPHGIGVAYDGMELDV